MIEITNKKVIIITPKESDKIVIIDYGMGNLGSIQNMFKAIGSESIITSDLELIKKAKKIVLPGVGSFDNGMKNIERMNLIPVLNDLVLKQKIPVLGICLGMQLMTKQSQEGTLKGLGWINGQTIKFDVNQGLKIPHMGWNNIKITKKSNLVKNLDSNSRFYFVHSYYVVCNESKDNLLETVYGPTFTSAFCKDNIFGVQFHPEKSHKYGLELLKNFASEV